MDLTCSVSDATHSGSGGWKTKVVGVKEGKGTIEVPFESGDAGWLAIGGVITSMVLKLGAGPSFTVASAIITNVQWVSDSMTGSHVMAVVSWESSGAVSGPSGGS
jgi:hypothetical protein